MREITLSAVLIEQVVRHFCVYADMKMCTLINSQTTVGMLTHYMDQHRRTVLPRLESLL